MRRGACLRSAPTTVKVAMLLIVARRLRCVGGLPTVAASGGRRRLQLWAAAAPAAGAARRGGCGGWSGGASVPRASRRGLASLAGLRGGGNSSSARRRQPPAAADVSLPLVRPAALGRLIARGLAGGGGGSGAARAGAPWYERHPVVVAVMVATVKTSVADILVQKQLEMREEIDWKRVALFTVFGAAYFGGFQYFLYVKCFSWWFDAARLSKMSLRQIFAAGGATRNNWLKQIGFGEWTVAHPRLFCLTAISLCNLCSCPETEEHHARLDLFLINHFFFTVYYAFKISICDPELGMGLGSPAQIGQAAWDKYMKNNFDFGPEKSFLGGLVPNLEDWIGFWKVWIIGDIIVFGMVPMWARLPVNNTISFIYVLVLSFMRGAPDDDEDAEK